MGCTNFKLKYMAINGTGMIVYGKKISFAQNKIHKDAGT